MSNLPPAYNPDYDQPPPAATGNANAAVPPPAGWAPPLGGKFLILIL